MEKKNYYIIDKLIVKSIIISFILLVSSQIFHIVFTDINSHIINTLNEQKDLSLKTIDIFPSYGNVVFLIENIDEIEKLEFKINGKKIDFIRNRFRIQFRDGDILELKSNSHNKEILVKVEYSSENVENINKNHIYRLKPEESKVILAKIKD